MTPEAIANAPALTFNQKDRLQHEWVRQALGQDLTFPTHWLPSPQSFVDASLAGMGWARNPVQLVREHLASGRLVELVADATLGDHSAETAPLCFRPNISTNRVTLGGRNRLAG